MSTTFTPSYRYSSCLVLATTYFDEKFVKYLSEGCEGHYGLNGFCRIGASTGSGP